MLDENKLFDFVKIMFNNQNQFYEIKPSVKKKHHFMINRFFSIKYPTQAQHLNHVGINGAGVVESWFLVAKQFSKIPGWIFTKTKKSKKQKESKYQPSDEAINLYKQRYELGDKEFKELEYFFKEDLYEELKQIEEQINVYG